MTGASERSRFQECEFVDIEASDCHVGHAMFDRCTFEDILSEDTTTLHEAEFLECTFRGIVRYLNFGTVPYAASPFHSETRQRQAIENLASRPFGIDVSQATLEECSVVGDEFTRKLRFRRDQGFLVRGERLDLVLEPELRDTQDLDFAECLTTPVANGVSQNVHFCAIPSRARHRRDYYVARVRELGVELHEDPMC